MRLWREAEEKLASGTTDVTARLWGFGIVSIVCEFHGRCRDEENIEELLRKEAD